eukprot:3811585-Prorocentrum_lima.AAC.1
MLRIQQHWETWHGMSRRRETVVRLHPTRRISKTGHKIPRNNRDRQQKRFEKELWRLIIRHKI